MPRCRENLVYTTTGTLPVANGIVFAGAAVTLDRPEDLKPVFLPMDILGLKKRDANNPVAEKSRLTDERIKALQQLLWPNKKEANEE